MRFEKRSVPERQPDFIWGREGRSHGFLENGKVLVSKRLNKGENADRQLLRMALGCVLLAEAGIDEKELSIPIRVDSEDRYGYITMELMPNLRISNSTDIDVVESLRVASKRLAMLFNAGCWLSLVPATHRYRLDVETGEQTDKDKFMWQNAFGENQDMFQTKSNLISLEEAIESIGDVRSPLDFVIYANIYRNGQLADLEDMRIGQGAWYPTSVGRRAGQIAFEFIYIAMRSIAINNVQIRNDLLAGNKESLISEVTEAFSYFWKEFLQEDITREELEKIKFQLSDYIYNDENAWVWDTNKNPPDKILTRQYYQIWNIAWIFANKIYDRGEVTQEAMMLDRVRTALGSVQEIFEKNGSEPVLVDEEFYNQIRGQSHFISPAQSMTQTNL